MRHVLPSLVLCLLLGPAAVAGGPDAVPAPSAAPAVAPTTPEGRHALTGEERGSGRAVTGTLEVAPAPDGEAWRVVRSEEGPGGGPRRSGVATFDGHLLRVRLVTSDGGVVGRLAPDGGPAGAEVEAVYRLAADGSLAGLVRERWPDGREVWIRETAAPATECASPAAAPEDLRARIVRAALAARDLGWDGGTPERQAAYAALLFPHDAERSRRAFASSMSSCGLFGMACLREAGVRHESLERPYAGQIGRAVTNLVVIGRERSAWTDARRAGDAEPQPGDMVLVGSSVDSAGWGGVEHVLVVVARRGAEVVSVDGGQAGHSIRERTRRLERVGAALWLRSGDGSGAGRRVQGWLDAGRLDPG